MKVILAAILFLAIYSSEINASKSLLCGFKNEHYYYSLPPGEKIGYSSKPIGVLSFQDQETYDEFLKDVKNIQNEIVTKNIENGVDSYIHFYRAYQAAKKQAYQAAKKQRPKEERNTVPDDAFFINFYHNYKPKFTPKTEGVGFTIELLNRIIKKDPRADRAAYLISAEFFINNIPNQTKMIFRNYSFKNNHVAGAIFITIVDKMGYLLLDPTFANEPVTVMLNSPSTKRKVTRDDSDEPENDSGNKSEPTNASANSLDSVEQSDGGPKTETAESSTSKSETFNRASPNSLSTLFKEESAATKPKGKIDPIKTFKYSMPDRQHIQAVMIDPDRKSKAIIDYYVSRPYCSFMETYFKRTLLYNERSIQSRDHLGFGIAIAHMIIRKSPEKEPALFLEHNTPEESSWTLLFLNPEETYPRRPLDETLYNTVLNALQIESKITDYKKTLREICMDQTFINLSTNLWKNLIEEDLNPVHQSKFGIASSSRQH